MTAADISLLADPEELMQNCDTSPEPEQRRRMSLKAYIAENPQNDKIDLRMKMMTMQAEMEESLKRHFAEENKKRDEQRRLQLQQC